MKKKESMKIALYCEDLEKAKIVFKDFPITSFYKSKYDIFKESVSQNLCIIVNGFKKMNLRSQAVYLDLADEPKVIRLIINAALIKKLTPAELVLSNLVGDYNALDAELYFGNYFPKGINWYNAPVNDLFELFYKNYYNHHKPQTEVENYNEENFFLIVKYSILN